MNTETPPVGRAPRKAAWEPISLGGVDGGAWRWLYAFAAVLCLACAAYMYVELRRSPTSAYVVAPSIGALWFVLRFLMVSKSGKNPDVGG